MKNLILTISLIATFANVFSQDNKSWKINSVSFSTGETPLTKGNTLSSVFSKEKSVFLLDYNGDLGEMIYFYSSIKQFSFGPSGGIFKNTLWFGPIVSFSLFHEHLKTLNWVGWSFGDPEKGSTSEQINFCFSYQQISLIYWGFEGYYILQHYQKNPAEHIFGLKKTLELNKNFSIFFGGGYMLNAEKFLWSTGLSYNFKN